MIHGNRIHVLACTAVGVFIGVTLASCSASTSAAPKTQIADAPPARSDLAAQGSAVPEVVITASRLTSPRTTKETRHGRP